jgi:hypothetical protein
MQESESASRQSLLYCVSLFQQQDFFVMIWRHHPKFMDYFHCVLPVNAQSRCGGNHRERGCSAPEPTRLGTLSRSMPHVRFHAIDLACFLMNAFGGSAREGSRSRRIGSWMLISRVVVRRAGFKNSRSSNRRESIRSAMLLAGVGIDSQIPCATDESRAKDRPSTMVCEARTASCKHFL